MKHKEVQQINLNKETREMLRELAQNSGVSMSAYIDRLILQQYILEEQKKERKH